MARTPRPRVGTSGAALAALGFALVPACESEGAPGSETASKVAPIRAAPSVLAQAVPAPAPASSDEVPVLQVTCDQFCGRLQALRCGPAAACVAACTEMVGVGACRQELAAFFDCALREPNEHWECDEQIPALKEGRCETRQAAFARCAGGVQ